MDRITGDLFATDQPIDPRCTPTAAEIVGLRQQIAHAGPDRDIVLATIMKTYRVTEADLG